LGADIEGKENSKAGNETGIIYKIARSFGMLARPAKASLEM
jgi:hypothetical protein